jgi:hypothetical protein
MKSEHKLSDDEKYPIGAKFWYQSKYASKPLEGIVESFNCFDGKISGIKTTSGVYYSINEITIESELVYIREEKLKELGI